MATPVSSSKMDTRRGGSTPASHVLTPQALDMLRSIEESGSFAGAARALGMVPSALTYRVRQIEDALDVLLFDRTSRQARATAAGAELLAHAPRVLGDLDTLTNRVRRVASGWEPQLTVAVENIVSRRAVLEVVGAFLELGAPTQIRVRDEVLSGTVQALSAGRADLAIGIGGDTAQINGLWLRPMGTMSWVFAVAPGHPLAQMDEPLAADAIRQHRAAAVADSSHHGSPLRYGLLDGQDVLTLPSMAAKLDAQLMGIGCGYLPECLARPYIEAGLLVARKTERTQRQLHLHYAWRTGSRPGKALAWWLATLEKPATRRALLGDHPMGPLVDAHPR